VRMGLFTEPAAGLVNETILVVVNANRANGAFAEIEDFVTVRWPLTSDGSHLIVAVQMILVSPVAEFHTLEQLVGDIRVAGRIEEGGEPIQAGEDAVLNRVRRHMAGPAQDCRHAETAFEDRTLGLRERRRPAIGPGEAF